MLTDEQFGQIADALLKSDPTYDPTSSAGAAMRYYMIVTLKKFEVAYETCGYQLTKK